MMQQSTKIKSKIIPFESGRKWPKKWTNAVHEITMPFRNYAMSFEFIRLVRLYLGFRTYSFDLRSFTLILRHYSPSKKTDDLDKNDGHKFVSRNFNRENG